jgi:polar amino acid transport system substrate-binding protein
MSRIRNHAFLYLVPLLLGALLLGCGCVSEQPGGVSTTTVPTTAVSFAGTIGSLTFYTEQMPPFNYMENGTVQGIAIDLLNAIAEKMGTKVSRDQIHLVPWSEAYQAALTGNNTVVFETARIPSRETLFKWAGPFYTDRDVLFARPDRGIVINLPEDLEDLQGYRIGVITDDAAIPQLLDIGVNQSQLVQETNASTLAAMLQDGEIDLWAFGETQGRYFTAQVTGNADAFQVVYVFPDISLYYAFSRDVPDATVQSFQQALDALKTEDEARGFSEYDQILYQYLGARCAQQTSTDTEVMNLVNTTALAIQMNASDTFRRINAREVPYWNPANPTLYVFVYDTNLTVVAQANNIRHVGVNFKGKTDVTGKPFRDEIIAGALQNGTGWVEYVFSSPVESGLFYKTTYYRLTRGSDGMDYVVCSGNYPACPG